MKKLIRVLCILSLLLIAVSGCSNNNSIDENKEDEQKQTLASVAMDNFFNLEDIPAPYETITDVENYATPVEEQAYNMETDFQYYYRKTIYSEYDIAETESTIFFLDTYLNEAYIKMLDKESKTIQPFCNKPECAHTTEECNSYFKDVLGMFYYNEYLYIMRQEYYANEDTWDKIEINLYRISIETQEREKVKNIATALTEDSTECYYISYIQHRGWLYYIYDIGTGSEKDLFYNNGSNSLYRINIENNSEKECIANMERVDGLIVDFLHLQAAGSYVYYMIPNENGMGEVYRFNTEALKNEALNLGEIATENFVIWDGDIYYKKYWEDTQIYKLSSDMTKEELYIDTQISGYENSSDFFVGEDYMYVTSFNEEWATERPNFAVLNKAGEYVSEFEAPTDMSINLGGKDIFVSYDWGSKSSETYIGGYAESEKGALYILDIDDIKENKEDNIFTKIDL